MTMRLEEIAAMHHERGTDGYRLLIGQLRQLVADASNAGDPVPALESVRSEALKEAAKMCDLIGEENGNGIHRKCANTCAEAIRDLSPARVAEGEPVREALSNLVSLLLQTMEPIGPMRDRKDYPPELQTAINVLRASPAREDVHSTELRK